MNTKYMFKFKDDTNTAFEYEAASLDEAVIEAEHEVKLRGGGGDNMDFNKKYKLMDIEKLKLEGQNKALHITDVSGSTFVNADCFDVFPFIEDKSIDAIICDLPYGITKCKWDSVLDLNKLWEQYERIIKDNGVVVLFAQTPFDKVLGCSNLEWLKYEWIWEKTQATGHFNAKKMPMKAHENILVFYNKPPKFNPQKTEGHKPINTYTRKAEVCNKTEVYGKVKQDVSGGGETDRYPRSVQVFASDKQKTKLDGTIHPTQKPLALLEMLVKSYTNEGDMVLDNTMGSGTTNLACIKLNRKSIGIEKEKQYYDIAVRRALEYCY